MIGTTLRFTSDRVTISMSQATLRGSHDTCEPNHFVIIIVYKVLHVCRNYFYLVQETKKTLCSV